MGFVQNKQYYIVAFVFTVLCVSGFREVLAVRPLEGDHWLNNNDSNLHFQSLKGTVPAGGNPCTNLPKKGNGRCTMEMDVAGGGGGGVGHAPGHEAFPGVVVTFGAAASVANDSKKQV